MNSAINLLPWRLEQHQRRSRQGVSKLAVFSLLVSIGYLIFNQFAQDYQQRYTEQLQTQQSLQQQLNQVEQKRVQSQQRLQQQGKQSAVDISTDLVTALFDLLAELPLQQGELTGLQFSAQQFRLQGLAQQQSEFEQIHQFFKQYPQIKQLKLAQFSPQSDGKLHFEFQLQFVNMEHAHALDDIE
ncbi:competence protein ComB [Lonepinella sp. BR2271]|uniref:competence protein ComB n=1 Tax=Lonepinella sp. BR2271 TaxID=3434550 RepID=UPI003F6DE507